MVHTLLIFYVENGKDDIVMFDVLGLTCKITSLIKNLLIGHFIIKLTEC